MVLKKAVTTWSAVDNLSLLSRFPWKAFHSTLSHSLCSCSLKTDSVLPRVLLAANPRKPFPLHCVEDMLWKVLALTVRQQWGLSVWGPHSWLWKYDVVSRCIWGCAFLPLSVWSAFKPRRPTESFIILPRGTRRLCGCFGDPLPTWPLWFLSLFPQHSAESYWECTLSISRGPPGWNSTHPLICKCPFSTVGTLVRVILLRPLWLWMSSFYHIYAQECVWKRKKGNYTQQ